MESIIEIIREYIEGNPTNSLGYIITRIIPIIQSAGDDGHYRTYYFSKDEVYVYICHIIIDEGLDCYYDNSLDISINGRLMSYRSSSILHKVKEICFYSILDDLDEFRTEFEYTVNNRCRWLECKSVTNIEGNIRWLLYGNNVKSARN
jgi:hypothetical protein